MTSSSVSGRLWRPPPYNPLDHVACRDSGCRAFQLVDNGELLDWDRGRILGVELFQSHLPRRPDDLDPSRLNIDLGAIAKLAEAANGVLKNPVVVAQLARRGVSHQSECLPAIRDE